MHVKHTRQRSSLSAVVVESQQLESGIVLGAQVTLYLVLIAKCLQSTAGHQEFFSLRRHTIVSQQVAENFEVAGLIGTRILGNLLEVGERAPLALLVGNDGFVIGFATFIVTREEQLLVVVIITMRGVLVPVQTTCSGLDVVF